MKHAVGIAKEKTREQAPEALPPIDDDFGKRTDDAESKTDALTDL